MKVNLIASTPNPVELLLFAKNTRLEMSPEGFEELFKMPESEKLAKLGYVFDTISSTWEFVDFIFLIQDVTRAFTHQLVRHRHESFAQQSQRTVDMEDFEYVATGDCQESDTYKACMNNIRMSYRIMIDEEHIPPQDARGVLPTNICTNILMKINLRSLSNLMALRLCPKAQGEFQNVAREMRRLVIEKYPWTEKVLQVHCVQHLSCAFPRFKECPVKTVLGYFNHPEEDEQMRGALKGFWLTMRAEAKPIASK